MAILAVVLVPKPEREHSYTAWNRLEAPLREKLLGFERNGYSEGAISCQIVQVWETDKRVILVPLKLLDSLKGFRDKGNFTIKKDSEGYTLVTPRWEENIKLKDRLEDLFKLFD